ncbi:MAG: hypothetical protein ABJG41_03505 [Cyclobacteriaceae bacterium]
MSTLRQAQADIAFQTVTPGELTKEVRQGSPIQSRGQSGSIFLLDV